MSSVETKKEKHEDDGYQGRYRVWMMYVIMMSQFVIYAQRTTLEQIVYFYDNSHDEDGSCQQDNAGDDGDDDGSTLRCGPLSEYERAMLQSAFYWGYVPFQVLGAAISKTIGAKTAITSAIVSFVLFS